MELDLRLVKDCPAGKNDCKQFCYFTVTKDPIVERDQATDYLKPRAKTRNGFKRVQVAETCFLES